MKYLIILCILVITTSCAVSDTSSPNNPDDSSSNVSCDNVFSSSSINAGAFCSTQFGKWTKYIYDSSSNTYSMTCDVNEVLIYTNQSDFNLNEQSSNFVSNNDYVKTDICASGSLIYTINSSTYKIYWEKSL